MVGTPRAVCTSWCTPAPCDSGATTSDASFSVVPGISRRGELVTTKPSGPWSGRPPWSARWYLREEKPAGIVVWSTAACSISVPLCAAIAALNEVSPNLPSPIRQVKAKRRARRFNCGCVVGNRHDKGTLGARGVRQIGNLVSISLNWSAPRIAPAERCQTSTEHIVAILGVDQDAIALDECRARPVPCRQRRAAVDLAQGPCSVPQIKPTRSAVAGGHSG